MTLKAIGDRLLEMCTLFEFTYNGKDGNIDPYYTPQNGNTFLLYYDGKEQTVYSIDEVLSTPFIDGKCLNEIYDQIEITDW